MSKEHEWAMDETQMTNRYKKNAYDYYIIRDLQIKTTVVLYLMPARMAIMQKSENNQSWRGYEKHIPY